jgi:hypothetical protein
VNAPAPEQDQTLDPLLQVWRAILLYGTLAFAAGFVFGVIRELLLIPLLGRTPGRWLEFVVMIAITFGIARHVARKITEPTRGHLIALGIGGMIVLLALEALFALYVVQLPLEKYLDSFNVLKGELFPWGLATMAIAPLMMHRLSTGRS